MGKTKKKPNPSRTHTKACKCAACATRRRRDRDLEKVPFGRRVTATAGAGHDIQRHRVATHKEPRLGSGSVLAGLIDAAGGAEALVQPAPARGTFTVVGDHLVRITPRRGKEKVFDLSSCDQTLRVELMLNTDGEYVFEVSLNGKVLGTAPLGDHLELQSVMRS